MAAAPGMATVCCLWEASTSDTQQRQHRHSMRSAHHPLHARHRGQGPTFLWGPVSSLARVVCWCWNSDSVAGSSQDCQICSRRGPAQLVILASSAGPAAIGTSMTGSIVPGSCCC